jgi:DNA-binding NarL/FixJ family response regulator
MGESTTNRIKVIVADEQPLILAGIRGALDGVEDITVVGEARSAQQLLPLVSRTAPDVVMLDAEIPGAEGLGALRRIRSGHPSIKTIVLTATADPREIAKALELGACGVILKSIDPFDLAAVIRQALRGTFFSFGGFAFRTEPVRESASVLSSREREVLQRVAVGLSNRAIAKELWLSDQTVKFHLNKIYRKLGVANRTEAARYAFDVGLAESVAPRLEVVSA